MWVWRLSALALGLALTATAVAAPSGVTNASWLSRPSGEDFSEAYPPLADALRLDGRAMVSCKIDSQGLLINCAALAAAPAGLGFDAAALSLTPRFRMAPTTADGQPVAGEAVRIPFRFTVGAEPPAIRPRPLSKISPETLATARQLLSQVTIVRELKARGDTLLAEMDTWSVGADPQALATAKTALQKAWNMASAEMDDVLAVRLVERLGEAELARWLAYSKTSAQPALSPEGDTLEQATKDLALREAEQKTTLAFLRSPSGRLSAGHDKAFNARLEADVENILRSLSERARTDYCEARSCSTELPPLPFPTP